MKIGLFGDSFAQPNKLNPTPNWVEIISLDYDVTNHAVGGSNLYYSVKEIKKHHEQYDKIILVVTEPGRLRVASWLPLGLDQQFIVGLFDRKFAYKDIATKYEKIVLEAANQYFTYLQNTEYDYYIHNLMIKDILELRPDTMLIPAFPNSFDGIKSSCMYNIYLKENNGWGFDWKKVLENFKDTRNCHLTAENNEIFANKVKEWLNGEPVQIDLDDFVTTTNKDFYLTPL